VARFVMKPEVLSKLFATIAPWYSERNGGYTRIVRIGRRLGDAGETAYLELIKSAEQKEQERSARVSAAEAKVMAQSGEKAAKKKKADAEEEAEEVSAEDRPKRGRKKEGAGAGAGGGGGKRRTGPRKVGGG
jgi:large subunit ribosomal protein L17